MVVGLLMGTRLWYEMWDAEKDDDAAFERRVDHVMREIGERGKLIVPESVPPERGTAPTPTPAPEQTSVSTPAPTPAREQAPAPVLASSSASTTLLATDTALSSISIPMPQQHSATAVADAPSSLPAIEQEQTVVQQPSSPASFAALGTSTSLMEVSAFMTEQLKAQMAEQRAHDDAQHTKVVRLLVERDEQIRVEKLELEAHRKELEAKLEEQRQSYQTNLEAQRQELEAKLEEQRQSYEAKLEAQRKELEANSAVNLRTQRRDTQIIALQLRLEVLREAKLLGDDEVSALEDKVADVVGVADIEKGDSSWDCLMQMIKLSEGITSEKTFARQLRRKFV